MGNIHNGQLNSQTMHIECSERIWSREANKNRTAALTLSFFNGLLDSAVYFQTFANESWADKIKTMINLTVYLRFHVRRYQRLMHENTKSWANGVFPH